MTVGSLVFQVVQLALNGSVRQDSFSASQLFETALDFVIDAVEESGNRREQSGLQDSTVFSQLEHISTEEANLASMNQTH